MVHRTMCLALAFAMTACSNSESAADDVADSAADATMQGDAAADTSPQPDAAAEGSTDATEDVAPSYDCNGILLGYPCMTAANHVCPQGGLDCYGIYLQNVCGPPDRACSTAAPACGASDQTCFGPLFAGHPGPDDGICLTQEEMDCFCSRIGLMQKPSFCPITDADLPGMGAYCACEGYCPHEDGKGPCKSGLTCVRYQCRGPACTDNPDTCPAGMQCVTFLDYNQNLLGKACDTK
ncbi:MAG TPA: hypothetical protein PLI95_02390 [Polyangiaceae bacterium]|nr:hypothetical protein [Polyangiaceae bacterium]